MPRVCFEIEIDTDTGEVMAGVCPAKEENDSADMEEDKTYLKPVKSVDEALAMAHGALASATHMGKSMPMAESSMQKGYNRAKGPPM